MNNIAPALLSLAVPIDSLKGDPRNVRRKAVTCVECGKVRIVRADTNPLLCPACASSRGGRALKPSRLTGYMTVCLQCGSSFRAIPSSGQKYCTKRCADDARANRPQENRTCGHCGNVFAWRPHQSNSRGSYCSLDCRNAAYQNYYRGKWIIVKAEPREGWNRARRHFMQADNTFCNICGIQEGLHVHHIIPWRASADDSDSNLVTLCRKHHTAFQRVSDGLLEHPPAYQYSARLLLQAWLGDLWHVYQGRKLGAS